MRAFAGQAARHTGRLLHFLVQVAFALVILAAAGLGALSWRLAQAPLDLPWLAQRLEAALNADAKAHVRLGGAALAWEGFRAGTDKPLDIRLTGLTATDDAGLRIAAIPRADVALSVGALLLGRLVPRAIVIDGARLRVVRAADGGITLDLGGAGAPGEPAGAGAPGEPAGAAAPGDAAASAQPAAGVPAAALRELTRPPAGDAAARRGSRWGQLRRLRIHDAAVEVLDRQQGLSWRVPSLEIDAHRAAAGGLAGQADATLLVGGQRGRLTLQAVLHPDSGETDLAAQLSQITPALLAGAIPGADALAAIDAPVTLSGSVRLDRALQPLTLAAHAVVGAGALKAGTGQMPVVAAVLDADGTPAALHATLTRLEVAPRPDGPRTVLQGSADLTRGSDGAIAAAGTLDLDRVAFADLPALWPQGTGGPGARPWITENLTAGIARDGHVEFAVSAPADLSDATLSRLAGKISGEDVTIHWLRPVPPLEHAAATLTLVSPDVFDIAVTAGRQAGGAQGGVQVRGGHVLLSGMLEKDQFADIDAELAGPVPDLLTLLRDPKVKLLDRSPLPVRDAAGQIAGRVTVTHLPLRDDVTMDDVRIHTSAKLTGLRLAGIAAGRDVDRGSIALDAGPDGLHATGTAQVSGVPAQLQVDMDFRSGPPSQTLQQVVASATLDARQMAAFGLDTQGALSGEAAVSATYAAHRDGHAEAVLHGDLARAGLNVAAVALAKPVGEPATLDARVLLDGGRITAIDRVRLEGRLLRVAGDAGFAAGQPDLLHIEQAIIGRDTDAHGQIQLPRRPGDPWVVSLAGTSVDLSGQLAGKPGASADPAASGPPVLLDAQFGRVVLGSGRALIGVAAHVEHDGRVTRRAHVAGQTEPSGPFEISVAPQAAGRRLEASASDTGALLRAFDVLGDMQGGRLTLTGRFDDSNASHTLTGTAEIATFRIKNAPVLGRVLKAMTLYGLVDVLSGPGLGFSRLVAPFRFAGGRLTLSEARAFSASLGMTAQGTVDLTQQSLDLQGTIVPAYFFNSLLGDIPLVGRLFSPERGGGVLSATYAVRGPLGDPNVSVNPLAALTPGVLRKLFGIFDQAK